MHAVKDYCNAVHLASNGSVRVSVDDPTRPFVIARLGTEDVPPQPKGGPACAADPALTESGGLLAVDDESSAWCAE